MIRGTCRVNNTRLHHSPGACHGLPKAYTHMLTGYSNNLKSVRNLSTRQAKPSFNFTQKEINMVDGSSQLETHVSSTIFGIDVVDLPYSETVRPGRRSDAIQPATWRFRISTARIRCCSGFQRDPSKYHCSKLVLRPGHRALISTYTFTHTSKQFKKVGLMAPDR